jgi:hypothetical protein
MNEPDAKEIRRRVELSSHDDVIMLVWLLKPCTDGGNMFNTTFDEFDESDKSYRIEFFAEFDQMSSLLIRPNADDEEQRAAFNTLLNDIQIDL